MPIDPSIMAQFEVLNPRAAALLSLIDTSGVVACATSLGEPNLLDQRRTPPQYLHDPSGALQEAVAWVGSHSVDKVDFLIVFGIGLGAAWQALLPWLQAKRVRRLVFIEDDLAIIQAFLESDLAKPFFEDAQSTLLYLEEGEEGDHVKEMVIWYAYERSWSCLPSPAYARYRMATFQALSQELTVWQASVAQVLAEYIDFRTSPLRNFGRNVLLWQKSINAASLFNKFRGCPAVVVAAGPSLEKEIELLKGLDSKALVLAGGSAVNALLQAGIMPHLAASVDPNPMQYIRLRQIQPFCLPLLYRSRALYEAVMYHQGPFLYLRGGDGYPIVEWFEHTLGIHGKILDGGHSVSNMLIDIAHALGCRPIIMVGYDLAYTGGARYANSLSESMAVGETMALHDQMQSESIHSTTYDGRDILTEPKWVTEAQWIEQFKDKHPRLQLINTAQDGLAIHGVEQMPFAKALEQYCSTTQDIEALLHLALQEATPASFSKEKLAKAVRTMTKSFERTSRILQKMMRLLVEVDITSTEPPGLLEAGDELEKELAFRYGLSTLFMMHTKMAHMRKYFDCRPFLDEERDGAYERKALKERLRLLDEGNRYYLSFFYTFVAWGCLNGYVLPNALQLAPLHNAEIKASWIRY